MMAPCMTATIAVVKSALSGWKKKGVYTNAIHLPYYIKSTFNQFE